MTGSGTTSEHTGRSTAALVDRVRDLANKTGGDDARDLVAAANLIDELTREMHARELHHFETEQLLAAAGIAPASAAGADARDAQQWLANYHGSIDSTALILAFTAGQRSSRRPIADSVRDTAIDRAYNAVTGQDDEQWNPDKTLHALQELWSTAAQSGQERGCSCAKRAHHKSGLCAQHRPGRNGRRQIALSLSPINRPTDSRAEEAR